MNDRIPSRKLSLRCSALPLILRCAAAAQRPELLVHETCEAAHTGTHVHGHLRRIVETGSTDQIHNGETRVLVGMGRRMWFEHLRDLFPSPRCENELSVEVLPGVTVTGHTDVQSGMIGTCRVLDWKSGRKDTNYSEQLLGYAALAMLENHAIERVETHIAWLHDYEVENYSMDRSDLPAWVEQIRAVADWSGGYESGEHCDHCPRSYECPGHRAIVRRDVSALLELEELESGLAQMTAERKLDLFRKAKLVGNVAERVCKALRGHVDATGDVVAGDAKLTVDIQRKRKIDTFAAWPVLLDVLDDREVAACCDVRPSKLDEIVAHKAGRGNGAAAKRHLKRKLEEVDALHFTEIRRLTERRT